MDTEADIKPVIHDEGITYSYVTYNSLYLLAEFEKALAQQGSLRRRAYAFTCSMAAPAPTTRLAAQ